MAPCSIHLEVSGRKLISDISGTNPRKAKKIETVTQNIPSHFQVSKLSET